MFEKDIIHYLKEFSRVLKPDGLILTSFFILDKQALASVNRGKTIKHRHTPLTFSHKYSDGCYVNDLDYPEGAVGFEPPKLKSMLRKAGLGIHGRHIHRGSWSGMKGSNGQDIIILEKISSSESFVQSRKPLLFTVR